MDRYSKYNKTLKSIYSSPLKSATSLWVLDVYVFPVFLFIKIGCERIKQIHPTLRAAIFAIGFAKAHDDQVLLG
jgi:hypothetical protein